MTTRHNRTVLICNDLGLHLRAAGLLVQLASRFKSEIRLCRGEAEANAKSIMSVLSLGASKGVQLELFAEGADAENAIAEIAKLIEAGFETE